MKTSDTVYLFLFIVFMMLFCVALSISYLSGVTDGIKKHQETICKEKKLVCKEEFEVNLSVQNENK